MVHILHHSKPRFHATEHILETRSIAMEVDGAGPAVALVGSLLEPETLELGDLLSVLTGRGIPVPDGVVDREEVMVLFRQHVLPRPQREARHRRGRRPTVKRGGDAMEEDTMANGSSAMRVGSPMAGSMSFHPSKATRIGGHSEAPHSGAPAGAAAVEALASTEIETHSAALCRPDKVGGTRVFEPYPRGAISQRQTKEASC